LRLKARKAFPLGANAAQAHSNEGIKLALKAGVSTIEHASYIDKQIISLFLQTGAIAVSTLLASRRQVENLKEIPDYMAEKISKHLEKETDSVKKLIDAGVLIAGGTDAGTPFNPYGERVEQLKILSECGGKLTSLKSWYLCFCFGSLDTRLHWYSKAGKNSRYSCGKEKSW